MRLQIMLVELAFCSTLFCLTNAVPAGGSGEKASNKTPRVRYSREENEFLLKEGSDQLRKNKRISWSEIAKAHGSKVKNKAPGFTKNRTATQLSSRFEYAWKYKNEMCTPNSTKRSRKKYTKEEEEFINKELLSDSYRFCHLNSDLIWKDILEKHDAKRKQWCDGFSSQRTAIGLQTHFWRTMRREGRISQEVKDRFSRFFKHRGGSTSSAQEIHPETGGSTSSAQEIHPETGGSTSSLQEIHPETLWNEYMIDEHGVDHSLFLDSPHTSSAEDPMD